MTHTPLHANVETAPTEAFAQRLVRTLNDGALCLMVSLGHRTGLFDIMNELPPSTVEDIAQSAGLNARYVREWLGAMVTGRVVAYDSGTERYWLPLQHADALTRAAGANNMAVFAQYIGGLGFVEDAIVECFKNGGGVPYEQFPRFHEVMAEDSGQSVLSSLESQILPLVPGLTHRLERGIRTLDLGCGRGRILHKLATLYPNSQFTGIDLSEEAIAHARAHAEGLGNVHYWSAI